MRQCDHSDHSYNDEFIHQIFTYMCCRKILYYKKKLTSKLQRTTTNLGFINKVIHNQVIQKFPEIKGQFLNNNDKHDSEMKILHSH